MDPLSDVLSLLRPRSYVSAGLDAGGDWAISYGGHEGIKFNAVMRGSCWVSVEGGPKPQRLEQGDCFLLTQGRPFILAADPSLEPVDSSAIYDSVVDGVATCNGGGDFFLVGCRFTFSGDHIAALFSALPSIVHVREPLGQASVLRWSLDQMTAELRDRQPGGVLLTEHLAHIMLVQVLRMHLAARHRNGVGWFFALSDRQIGTAVSAMHADPSRRWTLSELASLAGMSRSTFAQRFKELVGASPMDYLTRWRMFVAGERLRSSHESISAIALSLGYESESAFSTAFKRTMSCSPRQFQRQQEAG